jgi:glycosyltransferase involved in cell wall biosynthesis
MEKKICMFVWNHFTNDARVMRECTALSEQGYHIDLICIHDPKDKSMPFKEEINERFTVMRVRRYPHILMWMQDGIRALKQNKWLAVPLLAGWFASLWAWPLTIMVLSVIIFLLLKTKLKKMVINICIIIRMIKKGIQKKYDIYHANDLNTLPQGFTCAKLRFSQKKLVYDSHEVQTSRTGYGQMHARLERYFIKKADAMIVENHTRAKYNEQLYGFYPNVVHNYPFKVHIKSKNIVNLQELLGLQKGEKILLYQGGIQTGRGLDKLIEAVPLIKEGIVVLIGDGKIKEELIQKVREMALEERVKFLPKVPLQDLPSYTADAYIGFQILNNVCFNHYSASSNKLFEYMMAGVPVVACSFPEIKKVVEGEEIGLCIDSHNPAEIAWAVNELTQNREKRDIFSKNAVRARHKYNWDIEKEVLIGLYEKLEEANSNVSVNHR